MGLAVSVGKDNDELVDNLVSNDSVKTEQIEKIMRLVDRGKFMPETERENAYKDSAWKVETDEPGALHISAPCIYASILENLDLGVGMSFLNIGSGTGYLSSMVGFIIGEKGISHGVELYPNVVEFAIDRISALQQSNEASAFEWCVPKYIVGNAFQIESEIKYDRIYCGALVPESRRAYFCSFLKVGGVIIMPYGHSLQRIVRSSENEFITRDISAVTFSHLIPVNPDNQLTNSPTKLPPREPPSLRLICRNAIRQQVRRKVEQTHKLEMRIICNSKTLEQTHRVRDEDESSQGSEQRAPVDNARRIRQFRRFPVIFVERGEHENDGDHDEERDRPPGANHRFNHPMRHLFALVARERLNRHHAARARQQAGLNNEGEPEQHFRDIRLRINEQIELGVQRQNSDNEFGFRFITENRSDDEDQPLRTLFDENENDNRVDEEEETDETYHDNDTNTIGENEAEESRENITGTIDSEESVQGSEEYLQGSVDEMKQENGIQIDNENNDDNVDSNFIPLATSSPLKDSSMEPNCGSGSGSVKSANTSRSPLPNMGKRHRSLTAQSSENSPHARKIKRTFSRDLDEVDKSTRSAISNESDLKSQVYNGDEHSTNEYNADDELPVHESSSASSDNKPSSDLVKSEEKERVSAEQQEECLREFHNEFIRILDTLPLNNQMRRFLKQEFN